MGGGKYIGGFSSLAIVLILLIFFSWVIDKNPPTGPGEYTDFGENATSEQGATSEIRSDVFITVHEQDIGDIVDIGGKLAYQVERDGKWFIILNGEEIGKQYAMAIRPVYIGGKLAYQALLDGKWCVVYDGKEGPLYDNVNFLTEVGGKLAYQVKKDGKWYIIYEGEEVGKQYGYAGKITDINGELVYVASQNGKEFVVYGGKEGKRYDAIEYLRDIGGKLTYKAKENDTYAIITGEVGD